MTNPLPRVTIRDRTYAVIPDSARGIVMFNNVGGVIVDTLPGDRRVPDDDYAKGAIRRAGLDGGIDPFGPGAQEIGFNVRLKANSFGASPGDWLNVFELNAKPEKGGSDWVGPFRIILEKSKDGNSYYRGWYQETPLSSPVRLFQVIAPKPEVRARFIVRFLMGGDMSVVLDGKQLATVARFGWGYGTRLIYACYRVYCNEREGPLRVDFELL